MQILTGGLARESAVDLLADRSGEFPEPMVKVQMGKD